MSQGVTMRLVSDSENETRIHTLLAERSQLQSRLHELTVELECARQYTAAPGPVTAQASVDLGSPAWTS
jgi:hypothetical protein